MDNTELQLRRVEAVRAYVAALGGKDAAQAFTEALEAIHRFADLSGAPLGSDVFNWIDAKRLEAAEAHRKGLGLGTGWGAPTQGGGPCAS